MYNINITLLSVGMFSWLQREQAHEKYINFTLAVACNFL